MAGQKEDAAAAGAAAAASADANGAAANAAAAAGEQNDECPWCKYMKGGACRETFEAWQACVDGVMGKDMDDGARQAAIDSCSNVTQPLFECMMRHRDYYGPQLASMGGGGGSGEGGGSGSGEGEKSTADGGSGGGGGDDVARQPHQQHSSSSSKMASAPS